MCAFLICAITRFPFRLYFICISLSLGFCLHKFAMAFCLLDYIISYDQLINSVSLSDFVSDHCALHATITCTRNHPERKKITYRCLKNINSNRL